MKEKRKLIYILCTNRENDVLQFPLRKDIKWIMSETHPTLCSNTLHYGLDTSKNGIYFRRDVCVCYTSYTYELMSFDIQCSF